MKENNCCLSEQDHSKMEIFIGNVLDAYKSEKISRVSAISKFAHVIMALDIGNYTEVISFFNISVVEPRG